MSRANLEFAAPLINNNLYMKQIRLQYISPQEVVVSAHGITHDQLSSYLKKLTPKWYGKGWVYTIHPSAVKHLKKMIQDHNQINQLKPVDRIHIQDAPQVVKNLICGNCSKKKEDDKLLLYDPLQCQRYKFVSENIRILTNKEKVIIICPQVMKQHWISYLDKFQCREYQTHIIFRAVQVLSFQKSMNLIGSLTKFNPHYVFIDSGQFLFDQGIDFGLMSQFLRERKYIHIAIGRKLTLIWKNLFKILNILKPTLFSDENWFGRRYNHHNYRQLMKILQISILKQADQVYDFPVAKFQMFFAAVPKSYYNQASTLKEGNKLQILTLNAKIPSIMLYISLIEKLSTKIVVIVSTKQLQKKIFGYLIESQIQCCNYDKISQFNKDNQQKICIVNIQTIKLQAQTDCENLPTAINKCQHVIYVDQPWTYSKQQNFLIQCLFRDIKNNYANHYCVTPQSYEQYLCSRYCDLLRQNSMHRNIKQKRIQQQIQNFDKQIQIKYDKYQKISDLYDIDDQYDKLQYQILKQAQRHEQYLKKPLYKIQEEQMDLEDKVQTKKLNDLIDGFLFPQKTQIQNEKSPQKLKTAIKHQCLVRIRIVIIPGKSFLSV